MALTLLAVVASQLPRVRDDIGQVIGVVPLYAAFLVIMALVGRGLALTLRFDAPAGRALTQAPTIWPWPPPAHVCV